MSVQIKPLGPRVLIRRLEIGEQETEAGLIIPRRAGSPTYKCEVVALGDAVTRPVAVGQQVLVTQFAGDEVKVDQESYFLVDEGDLLAVLSAA